MFTDITGWVEDHPFIVAIGIFLGFFVFYQYIKSRQSSANALPGATPTSNIYYDYSTSTMTTPGPAGAAGPIGAPGPTGPAGPAGPPAPRPTPAPIPRPTPVPTPKPVPAPASTAKYVTVQPWPAQLSTLWGIANYANSTLANIERLNPQYSSNWNLIYAGQKVRVS